MGTEKNLLDIFSRYTPSAAEGEILRSAAEPRLRADREARMIEIHASFLSPIEKGRLYAIESGIAEAYDLRSVRILPHYPPECFGESYIPQVLTEAERVGIVARGFFSHYTHSLTADKLTLRIPFAEGGVRLLYDASTPDVIGGIIRSEFGLDITVEIEQDPDASPSIDRTREYAALDRSIAEAEQAYHSAKSAPPPTEEKAEPAVQLKKVQTLLEAPPPPPRVIFSKWATAHSIFHRPTLPSVVIFCLPIPHPLRHWIILPAIWWCLARSLALPARKHAEEGSSTSASG